MVNYLNVNLKCINWLLISLPKTNLEEAKGVN
jgi:hypothetical protein